MSGAALSRRRDQVVRAAWRPRRVTRKQLAGAAAAPTRELAFTAVLAPDTAARVPEEAKERLLTAADRLLRGEWETFGVFRTDLERPDWFRNPVSGRRAAQDRYAFRMDRHGEDQAGNIRQVWELSRLQHLTLLATAWFVTQDERYAQRVADHLRSWWLENPFLSGVHWTSGVEVGFRLISMAWIRRLLDDWPGAAGLFERDTLALRQIRWHQQYLAAFPSRSSSASAPVIAAAAGQLMASCAFPWFPESERWRRKSALLLERELIGATSPSGIGRELASDYHCLIVELGFAAAVEADASGYPLRPASWARLCALADDAAASVDERLRAPCVGDSDENGGLLLDAPAPNRRASMLALAEELVGRQDWWPQTSPNAASLILGALAGSRHQIEGRPGQRPSRFADAGITLLRTRGEDEIWCRCDGAPNGYRSVQARPHADALSVAVRCGGVDILAGPGIFWAGDSAGPFRWLRHAHTREIEVLDDGDIARWTAEHDGCAPLWPAAVHRRSVLLDRASRSIDVIDQIDGYGGDLHLTFQLGPDIRVEIEESLAVVDWPAAATPGRARLELPPALRWSVRRGEVDSVLGCRHHGQGRLVSTVMLAGCGPCTPGLPLITRLEFLEVSDSAQSAGPNYPISWTRSAALSDWAPEIQAEAG